MTEYIGATVGFGVEVESAGKTRDQIASEILDQARLILGPGHDPFIVVMDDDSSEEDY